jgi:hypothetical protein
MKRIFMTAIGGVALLLSSSANASNAVFDFLDPCIEARDQFSDQRDQILTQLNRQIANAETAKSTEEYRKLWLASKKEALRAVFDRDLKPVLEAAGVKDIDPAYEKWFELQITQLSPEQLAALQDSNFRFELKRYLMNERGKTSDALETERAKLANACKMDVGNQALRVAIIGALKPFTFVAGNWKAAEKDGFIAQVIAAPTGINPVDAVKCPIRGCSSESVVNKVLKGLGL